ncbi:MAG: AzlC family ABC transporter permease [Actinomycetota bacterium]
MTGHRREALVLTVAVGVIGVTFGVLADAAGLSLPQIMVMSAFVFTGASQFAAVSVIDTGGSGAAAIGSALLLAARNALYGPVVARLLPAGWLPRTASSHFVIDETTAMASVQADDADARDAFWWTAVWLWSLWNLGSIGGALLGSVIGEPETWGLDAAFPAGFIALLAPHVRERPGQVAAFVGAALAIGLTPIAPAGVPLLVAATAVVPGWLVRRRIDDAGAEADVEVER